jgi:hypothetical protein
MINTHSKITIIIVAVVSLVTAFFLFNNYIYQEKQGDGEVLPSTYTVSYEDEAVGLRFDYTAGTVGYVLMPTSATEAGNAISAMTIFDTAEYEEFLSSSVDREGPGGISIRVYENVSNQSPFVWILENPLESNSQLVMGEVAETVVGGANAAHFVADGLWPIDTYVVGHGDYMYIFAAMLADNDQKMLDEFARLLVSVAFIPTSN